MNNRLSRLLAVTTPTEGGPSPAGTRKAATEPLQRSLVAAFLLLAMMVVPATAQSLQQGPPAVGVVTAEPQPITERTEINGRIQVTQRVDLVARVTGFLDERLFEEGAEVKKGDLLYRLERAPFAADVEFRDAAIAQAEAQLENTNDALQRAAELLRRGTATQVTMDNALAAQRSAEAQLKSAQAQRRQSQINLDYTQIRSPIDGRIGRTSVTIGNVVGPTTSTLATVVSQDPMYVTFPISVRAALDLRNRYASKGGFGAVRIRLRLPDGRIYHEVGQLEFLDIGVARDTDTILLRGVIANPILPPDAGGDGRLRELTNDEFVTVTLEAVEPLLVLAVPRAAILSDQLGDFVYVVDPENIARQRRVRLGQSTPETAAVIEGLKQGERVVVEGLQHVRPNAAVSPTPASLPGRELSR